MTQQAYIPDLAVVLAEVNRIRAERGRKPLSALPKGVQYEPSCCPLAIALQTRAVVPMLGCPGYYKAGDPEEMEILPTVLNDFGNSFDEGAYPELVHVR